MRLDYPSLDINPVFPGLGEYIIIIIVIVYVRARVIFTIKVVVIVIIIINRIIRKSVIEACYALFV